MSGPAEAPPSTSRLSSVIAAARGRVFQQAGLFVITTGLVSLLSAATMAVLARHMSVEEFGSFTFATSFLLFGALFFDFGFFLPAARDMARNGTANARPLLGASFLLYAPIGIAFCVAVFGCSFFVDDVFHVHAGEALRVTAAFAIVYPFALVAQTLAQGADRLHVYSVTTFAGQAVFVGALAAWLLAGEDISVTEALAARAIALCGASAAFIAWMSPRLAEPRSHIRRMAREAREWGFQVYVGRLLSIATYNMDVLMVAAFTNAHDVAIYSLAGATAKVVGLPVYGVATALFARMTSDDGISPRLIRGSWTVGLVLAGLSVLVAAPFVDVVFGSRYSGAVTLIPFLAMAECVRGVTTIYNTYLSAHARGKELRNAATILTVSNVALNVALIPPFGALGAAIASLAALIANYAAHVIYFRRSTKEANAPEPSPARPEPPLVQTGTPTA